MVFAQPSRSPKPTFGQQQTTSRYQAWSVQKFVLYGCRSEGLRFSDPAHQLLRQHGQELCKRSKPRCAECP